MTSKVPPFCKEYVQPEGIAPSPYYSDAISTQGGRTVFISGQTAYDHERQYPSLGFEDQVTLSLKNLGRVLAASGASFADVVQIRVYVKDYQRDRHLPVLSAALAAVFPKDKLPTSTLLGVTSLARENILFEIEAIAVARSLQCI